MSADDPLADFEGIVRLFPLPNLVLFPHVVQPLHIFEARYRQLMTDTLAGDRLITMALLRPGWEEDYGKRPPIFPVVRTGALLLEGALSAPPVATMRPAFHVELHSVSVPSAERARRRHALVITAWRPARRNPRRSGRAGAASRRRGACAGR